MFLWVDEADPPEYVNNSTWQTQPFSDKVDSLPTKPDPDDGAVPTTNKEGKDGEGEQEEKKEEQQMVGTFEVVCHLNKSVN